MADGERKRRVLVADDREINRIILTNILKRTYEVIVANDGAEALRIAEKEQEKLSLIMLDVLMPVMDGYTCLKHLKENPVLKNIPVIIATQQDSDADENKALAYGANDFVTKPYKAEIILRRVENLIKLRENAALINLMRKDSLTGLLSQDYFYELALVFLKEHKDEEYDIVVSNIANFKVINDLYGPENGNIVLKLYAELFRDDDVPVGRIGPDILAKPIKRQELSPSLFDDFNVRLNNVAPFPFSFKVVFGLYEVNDLSVPVALMCDRARLAEQAIRKDYGKAFNRYDEPMRTKILSEQRILDTMETALNEKQFVVYYQPKNNVKNGNLAGAEALVRWIHPVNGFMNPEEFIPLFERNGFISRLDQYVWTRVAEDLEGWLRDGKKTVPVSVNASRADFYIPNIAEIIYHIMESHHVPPSQLHIEVTESAYTDNPAQIIHQVQQLKRYGFMIEMDDFGTGYSSLNMLSDLPIDILKLDMKFIQNGLKQKNSKSILSFIISLAKWLDLSVIAEGVETKEQLDELKQMDCAYAQGYYFSKPVPKKAYEEIVEKSVIDNEKGIPHRHLVSEPNLLMHPRGERETILIVDDTAINRQILVSIFQKDYDILQAENGEEGITLLRAYHDHIAAILLDLIMPVMDGFQMLSLVKADDALKDIPIVVTSQDSKNNGARALSLAADDFIEKPYYPSLVRRRVSHVILSAKYIKTLKQ